MFAIIYTGGKQYRVKPDTTITIEKLPNKEKSKVSFDKVMMISDGKDVVIGQPFITGASVSGQLVKQAKGDKIIVRKFKNKTRYRRKQGHRQLQSQVKITEIKKA
ncbi:MAG: 50S ribosomal protein L21 [Patescibacteria group bacterium]